MKTTPMGEYGSNDKSRLAHELEQWWEQVAREEVERVVPKAVEYGATDLVDIGRVLARLIGRENMPEAEMAELGVFFYLEGKVARWRAAIGDGRRASDDTLHDIGVYVRMAQRIRYAGGWPTGPIDQGRDAPESKWKPEPEQDWAQTFPGSGSGSDRVQWVPLASDLGPIPPRRREKPRRVLTCSCGAYTLQGPESIYESIYDSGGVIHRGDKPCYDPRERVETNQESANQVSPSQENEGKEEGDSHE